MYRKSLVALASASTLALLAACADGGSRDILGPETSGSALRPSFSIVGPDVQVQLIAGNPTCASLIPGSREIKLEGDDRAVGTYGPITITAINNGAGTMSFTSTIPILGVIMKGGDNGNFYDYRPNGTFGDDGLVTPNNSSGGPAGVSHISFCWIPQLVVTKTAVPSYDRDWDWTIVKVNDQEGFQSAEDPIEINEGQEYLVEYTISGNATSTNHNFAVSGQITIANPAYNGDPAIISGVSDVIFDGLIAAVVCPVSFPYSLAAGSQLVCTYSRALGDNTTRLNTATASVTAASLVQGASGTASVDFTGINPTSETDTCIDIEDDLAPGLANREICLDDLTAGAYTFSYEFDVGGLEALECDQNNLVVNTASFETNNPSGEPDDTGSDQSEVNVFQNCETGGSCTLTQGYWKTHSIYGPAKKADAGWYELGALGPNTPFFDSGKTYYQVLWTQPAGNVYYTLAHQYIAAKLNILNGATPTAAVTAAMTAAEGFFAGRNPSTAISKTLKATMTGHASTLDQFNNGLIGPGHCDESSSN